MLERRSMQCICMPKGTLYCTVAALDATRVSLWRLVRQERLIQCAESSAVRGVRLGPKRTRRHLTNFFSLHSTPHRGSRPRTTQASPSSSHAIPRFIVGALRNTYQNSLRTPVQAELQPA